METGHDQTIRLHQVEKIAQKYKYDPAQLMRILLQIQAISANAIPPEVAAVISRVTDIPVSKLYGYITFYSMLGAKPRGKYIIRMCKSAPCYICGSQSVSDAISAALSIKPGETTADNLFSLEYCECIGLCDVSPAIMINDKVYGDLTPEKATEIIGRYKKGEVE